MKPDTLCWRCGLLVMLGFPRHAKAPGKLQLAASYMEAACCLSGHQLQWPFCRRSSFQFDSARGGSAGRAKAARDATTGHVQVTAGAVVLSSFCTHVCVCCKRRMHFYTQRTAFYGLPWYTTVVFEDTVQLFNAVACMNAAGEPAGCGRQNVFLAWMCRSSRMAFARTAPEIGLGIDGLQHRRTRASLTRKKSGRLLT